MKILRRPGYDPLTALMDLRKDEDPPLTRTTMKGANRMDEQEAQETLARRKEVLEKPAHRIDQTALLAGHLSHSELIRIQAQALSFCAQMPDDYEAKAGKLAGLVNELYEAIKKRSGSESVLYHIARDIDPERDGRRSTLQGHCQLLADLFREASHTKEFWEQRHTKCKPMDEVKRKRMENREKILADRKETDETKKDNGG